MFSSVLLVHHFSFTLLNFECYFAISMLSNFDYLLIVINSNSLYLSLRVSAIDNQESNIKSLLAGPNQSLGTVVTLVLSFCVCL